MSGEPLVSSWAWLLRGVVCCCCLLLCAVVCCCLVLFVVGVVGVVVVASSSSCVCVLRRGPSGCSAARPPPRPGRPRLGRVPAFVGAVLCTACPHASPSGRGRRQTSPPLTLGGIRRKALYGRRQCLRPPPCVRPCRRAARPPHVRPPWPQSAQGGPCGIRGFVPMHGGWPAVGPVPV